MLVSVMGQEPQHQGTHLLQLVMAYRPARPQLQVSLYMFHNLVVSVNVSEPTLGMQM